MRWILKKFKIVKLVFTGATFLHKITAAVFSKSAKRSKEYFILQRGDNKTVYVTISNFALEQITKTDTASSDQSELPVSF